MTDHQILAIGCGAAVLALIIIMARLQVLNLRDDLAMARHTIAALAHKAQAWDEANARIHNYSPERVARILDAARVCDGDTRVQYQHLSAECDGCDDTPIQHYPV